MERTPKCVDNAIQRVKTKLEDRLRRQEEDSWKTGRSV